MPYTHNGNTRLFYETRGRGPPLMLYQSTHVTHRIWKHLGYVKALRKDWYVITMDHRGVGRSDTPHDPEAYRPSEHVCDIGAVLDELGIESTHFWGYSAGARCGLCCAKLAPGRLRSLVLGGMSPCTDARTAVPSPPRDLLATGGLKGLMSFYHTELGQYWSPTVKNMVGGLDVRAQRASLSLEEPLHADIWLHSLQLPVFGYAGTDDARHDGLREACEQAPHGRFCSLDGLDHTSAYFERERILPQVVAFLREAEMGLQRKRAA